MKLNSRKCAGWAAALFSAVGLLSLASPSQAGGNKTFAGNGNGSFGGTIGNGTLTLTDDTTNITGTVVTGNNFNDCLVIYIQTTNGGFASTSGFNDTQDGSRHAIADPESPMTFVSGFAPNFGIALGPTDNNFGGLWKLTNGGNNSLPFVSSVNLTPTGTANAGTYTFTVPLANLGLPTGAAVVGTTIKLFGTYTANSGYRSSEAIAGNDSGNTGDNPFTQTSFGTYLIGELPTVTYPVTFRVDMSNCIASSLFNPATDTVIASGSFNANATTFTLAPGANPNIYTATFNDSNTLGAIETYKFTILPGAGGSLAEGTDIRSFTLANTQTLPLIYFSDFAPAANPTVPLNFSVNMGPQTIAGNFNPGNGDTVYAYGVFDQNAAFVWLTPPAPLTPSVSNTNVYVGSVGDGNYAGTFGQYKFVYHSVSKGQDVYESILNRDYTTPAASTNFPTVFFNNATNAVLVTFHVDMSAEIQFNRFTPGTDTIAVAGNFTGFAANAIACTNDPNAANTNIYTAVIPILDNAGTVEQYKFYESGPGITGSGFEEPASTGHNNRTVTLTTGNTNLPVVFFSDLVLSDVLLSNVTVVFTVDMTNAVGTDAAVWSAGVPVYINGDFLGFPNWNASLPQMTEIGSSSLYTYTNVFAAGSPVIVNYKYGMNGVDDEAGFAQNHVRYIRGYGTYNLPVDKFGAQLVESSFGNLAVHAPIGGQIPITWLGRPGVHLQTRTNLATGAWIDHPETDAISATNWPVTGSSQYFRLVHPY